MEEYCFVIQPYDRGDFDHRFDDIVKPVIEACGLEAYRVDRDPYVEIAVSVIEERIRDAALVIAEISVDNPNVWFELGYAMALNKPIIMMCDDAYRNGKFPFDISHRNVLVYRTGSLRDFDVFKESLKTRIFAKLKGIHRIENNSKITPEEELILKALSRDQKTAEAMTPEEKIRIKDMSDEIMLDCLKSLTDKAFLEYRYSTIGGNGFYQLTEKGNNILKENWIWHR